MSAASVQYKTWKGIYQDRHQSYELKSGHCHQCMSEAIAKDPNYAHMTYEDQSKIVPVTACLVVDNGCCGGLELCLKHLREAADRLHNQIIRTNSP